MYRFFLAGRYTFGRPVSYLAMVAIGLGVMALIVVVSIMNGFLAETRDFFRGTTADIIVFPIQMQGVSYSRDALEKVVTSHPDVTGACSRLVRPAVFKVHGRSPGMQGSSQMANHLQVIVLGVHVADELKTTDLGDYVTDVERPELRVEDPLAPFALDIQRIRDLELKYSEAPRVLMSESMMAGLGLFPGHAIDIVTLPDADLDLNGEVHPASQTFVISGAFNTGHYTHDQGNLYIDRAAFSAWSGTEHEASELYVAVDENVESLPVVRDQIHFLLERRALPSVVETWEDRHSIWLGAVENERNILGVVFLFFLLLVCTITFSVLTMMVQQKVRDVGILSAMGASAGGVGTMFATCGIYIATCGGLFGLGAGELLSAKVNAVKDFIEDQFGIEIFKKEVYAFTDIPVEINHGLNILIAVVTVIGAVVICLLPAFRAGRLDPVEALRHD